MITRTCDLHNKMRGDLVTYTRMKNVEDSKCPLCNALESITRLRHVLMDTRTLLIENGDTAIDDALCALDEEIESKNWKPLNPNE